MLRVCENRVLRRIYGSKTDGVTGEWRRLQDEELYDVYSSPNIIRLIKSLLRWAGHVARKGEEVHTESWVGGEPRESVDGKIILRWIFRKWDVGVWTGSSWLRTRTGGGIL